MNEAQGDSRIVRVEVTIMRQTFEFLSRHQEATGLSIGEVIDRLTLYMKPRNPELAYQLVMENIIVTLSELTKEQKAAVLSRLLIEIAPLLPPELVERMKEVTSEESGT